MKVIFLDHDGVICLSNNWGSRFRKQREWGGRAPDMHVRDIPISYRFDDFDKKSIKTLNSILKKSGAEIVVSSDWRLKSTLEELGDLYEAQGIIKRPIGITERFHFTNWLNEGFIKDHGEFPWSRELDLEQQRYFEIKRWLRDNPQVTHWVAIDDLHMGAHIKDSRQGLVHRQWGLENFVHTPLADEGIKQSGIKDKVLSFLND